MAEYQFATSNGEIIVEQYDSSLALTDEEVSERINAAFNMFPYNVDVSKVEDHPDVYNVHFKGDNGLRDVYICAKGTTPGGREALKDEQRIQVKAKHFNYVYQKEQKGFIGIFLGVYSRDGVDVFCAWKTAPSQASDENTPISKQIKIGYIAQAMREGIVQFPKGNNVYGCAFKPEFLYFYLRNYKWLHTRAQENDSIISYNNSTKLDITEKRNRIFFGAPGTGKSFELKKQADVLLKDGGYSERVTFHPDYSYANFVGTYKPVSESRRIEHEKDPEATYVLDVLTANDRTAQEKYDELFEHFKASGQLTRLPILLGLYSDEPFDTRKVNGEASDNTVEKTHGKALRKYVSLLEDKPISKEITYKFIPGPFMRVLVKAIKSKRSGKSEPHLLVIEEINRANVAAVFGDIFQLLDRGPHGSSEYEIHSSEDIRSYLADELGGSASEYEALVIPDNMFIWATMNSADQGVFPIDTAFKRRWDFTYIGIDEKDQDLRGKYVLLGEKGTQKVEWNQLRRAINNYLAEQKVNEDKQLGPYFLSREIVVPETGDEIDRDEFIKAFKNKVLMYLFEDAAKQKRSKVFEGCKQNNRYSEICKSFDEIGVDIFNKAIVQATDYEDLTPGQSDT